MSFAPEKERTRANIPYNQTGVQNSTSKFFTVTIYSLLKVFDNHRLVTSLVRGLSNKLVNSKQTGNQIRNDVKN